MELLATLVRSTPAAQNVLWNVLVQNEGGGSKYIRLCDVERIREDQARPDTQTDEDFHRVHLEKRLCDKHVVDLHVRYVAGQSLAYTR